MANEPLKCPDCGLYAPPGTAACDCDFDFATGTPGSRNAWLRPGFGCAFAVSVFGLVALNRAFVLLGDRDAGGMGIPITAVLFGGLAVGLSRQSVHANVEGAVGIFAGIAVGVGIDSVIDALLARPERNLWPLEILFLWMIVAIPVLIGVNAGCYAVRRDDRRR